MKRQHIYSLLMLTVLMALVLPGFVLAADGSKINLNTASVEELTGLDRVGPQYAQRIVDYRETVGPFKAPEDIMNVKGIGAKTYEANKDIIVVE